MNEMPEAWYNLLASLEMIAKRSEQLNEEYPLTCEHGKLIICASPRGLSNLSLTILKGYGFVADFEEDCFYSFHIA